MNTGKTCPKCKTWKSYKEFHKSKGRRDGHVAHCKKCVSKKHREWYLKNRKSVIKRTSEYRKTPKGQEVNRKAIQKYRQSSKGRQKIKDWQLSGKATQATYKYRKKYPEKSIAREKIHSAVRRGEYPKLTETFIHCEIGGPNCTERATMRHHHLGYEPEHWYDFQYVCYRCHKYVHQESDVNSISTAISHTGLP